MRPRLLRGRWLATATAVAVAAYAGFCGTDDNRTGRVLAALPRSACGTGAITGAGATFPQAIVQQWIKEFSSRCPGATVNYQAVGSGAGIQQFTEGTVDFGASDAVMKPDERAAAERRGGTVLHVPWTAGAIAVLYNLDGVEDLRLSGETLAAIYAGRITRWDDERIARENRGHRMPDLPVQVIHRSDGSGTTQVFTSYLSAVAPATWTAGAAKDVPWPVGQGAKGSDGVAAAVKQVPGAVGYAELSFAEAAKLGVARIGNGAGRFVLPTAEAVAAALAEAEVPPSLEVKVTYTPRSPAAYPISTTTWALVFARPDDATRGRLLKAFLSYVLGPGQEAAPALSYAPLPGRLAARALEVVRSIEA